MQAKSLKKKVDVICAANVICHVPDLKSLIKGKKFIIYDMRNIYSPNKIKAQGFKYYSVGR